MQSWRGTPRIAGNGCDSQSTILAELRLFSRALTGVCDARPDHAIAGRYDDGVGHDVPALVSAPRAQERGGGRRGVDGWAWDSRGALRLAWHRLGSAATRRVADGGAVECAAHPAFGGAGVERTGGCALHRDSGALEDEPWHQVLRLLHVSGGAGSAAVHPVSDCVTECGGWGEPVRATRRADLGGGRHWRGDCRPAAPRVQSRPRQHRHGVPRGALGMEPAPELLL